MKISNNIRLSLLTGVLTGIIISLIDVLSKIIVWSFEWFELYLIILTTLIITTTLFLIFGITIEIVKKIMKINNEKIRIIYFSVSITFIILFYMIVIINQLLIPGGIPNKENTLIIPSNILTLIFSIILFIIIIFSPLTKKIIKKMVNKKTKTIIHNFIFFIIIFIFSCYTIDIYLQEQIPTHVSTIDKEQPNIIFITLDTLRADHLGTYGYEKNTTPFIDEIANQSILFENAISTSSWTLPSHTSMFTGKYLSEHNVTLQNQYVSKNEILLHEILHDMGYATAGFIGGTYCKNKYGIAQGIEYYNDRISLFSGEHTFDKLNLKRTINLILSIFITNFEQTDNIILRQVYNFAIVSNKIFNTLLFSNAERNSEQINNYLFKWLDNNKNEKFYLFINYFDVHEPYNLGKKYRDIFTDDEYDYSKNATIENIEKYVNIRKTSYDAEIRYLDDNIQLLFNKLENLEILNNTLIILVSDHGEEFYDHSAFGHGNTLYEEVIHVPLIIYYPQKIQPNRISERVSIVDLYPTILELLNQTYNKENINGKSLIPLMNNSENFNERAIFSELFGRWNYGVSTQQAIYEKEWKYTNVTPENLFLSKVNSSLFNLELDPKELNNLIQENITLKNELQTILNNFGN
ncbi:MAG: sulfatase [Nanoarchaeota archaeon]|nr:sulfatase [Nanoarchaeota archaeon]